MRLLKFTLFLLLIYGTARFCHRATGGFQLIKVQEAMSAHQVESTPSDVEEILTQKFTYLSRGKQSFAFVSEDKKYVLKLLNNQAEKKIFWMKLLPSHPVWDSWKLTKIAACRAKFHKTFASYEIADSKLKQETAIIYLHLHKTESHKQKLTIIDKLGILHEMLLSDTAFILQKKVELCYPYLKTLKEKEDALSAKESIKSIVALLVKRCQMGIHDSDPLIRTNLGFIDAKPILLDAGPFSYSEKIKDPVFYKPEILRITASLKEWLKNNDPELIATLDQELEAL